MRQALVARDVNTLTHKPDGAVRILEGYDAFQVFHPQELVYYLETMGGCYVLGFHKHWDLDAEANRSDLAVAAEKPRVGNLGLKALGLEIPG